MGWIARIGLLTASLLLVLLAGEGIARWLAAARSGAPAGEELEVLDTTAAWTPGARGLYGGVFLRRNSRGLRGPEYPVEAGPGTFRILVVGDSVTEGFGVTEDATYAARLAGLLAAVQPGRRFEVLNAGLAGGNATTAAQRAAVALDAYRIDLLVYGFTLNDIMGSAYEREPERANAEARDRLWRRALRFHDSPSHLLRAVWPPLVLALTPGGAGEAPPDTLVRNYRDNPRAWLPIVDAFRALQRLARSQGICAHVFVHTHLGQLDGGHPYREVYARVQAEARARDLSASGSFEHVQGLDASRLWVGRFDPHPNAEGHRLFAEALAEALTALPARCWQPRAEPLRGRMAS